MDKLPEELVVHVCNYACLDDKRTTCALLLVSRKMKRIVTPMQWHSVALSGATQFCQFATELSEVTDHRPIYHLFVSDRAAFEAHHPWTRVPRDGTETIEQLHSEEEKERAQWRRAQTIVLEHAAPTLQSLTFIALDPRNSARRIGDMLKRVYPNLRELTLRVPPLQPLFASEPIDLTTGVDNAGSLFSLDSSKAHLLPNLKRLHIAGHFKRSTSAQSRIGAISSGVTHLRLSGIFAYPFTRELAAELFSQGIFSRDILTANPIPSPPSHFVPPSTRFVVIQPCTPKYSNNWGTDHGEDAMHLMETFDAATREGVQLLCLPPMSHGYYGYEQAKSDWLSRLNGGAGCWAPEDEIVARSVMEGSSEILADHDDTLAMGSRRQGYFGSFVNMIFGHLL